MDDVQVPQKELYNIRCCYTDNTRPPHADDLTERHWRCQARFAWDPYAPSYMQAHCPLHRHRPGPPATRDELEAALAKYFHRVQRRSEIFFQRRLREPGDDDL